MAGKAGSQLSDLIKPGQMIAGKYRVLEPLGSGNFAHVLKAHHEVMGRDVAIKVLKPEVTRANPEVSDRFLTEVRIVSRLTCPNTVTVYDFGETVDHGLLYMVLEHVDGVALDQVLKTGGMDAERAVKIALQVLKSLDEAHAVGVVHRDLKPGNIMLTKSRGKADFVKVLDFGVAKLMSDDDDEPASSTSGVMRRSTQFIGTPIYMSPEAVLGRDISPQSDFYALGLILYEMLTGEGPIDGTLNVAAVAQLHIDYKPLPFASLKAAPPFLREVILKATSRKPEDRYQSAREFARAMKADSTGDFQKFAEAKKSKSGKKRKKRRDPVTPPADPSSPFSGKNYVDIPVDIDEAPHIPAPTRRVPSGVNPSLKRPKSALELSSELQVDLGTVRREDLARKRRNREEVDRRLGKQSNGFSSYDFGWLAGGLFSFGLSFFLFSALIEGGAASRIFAGLSPFLIALLFTGFSSVRRTHGGVLDRIIVPLSRETTLVTLGGLILVSLSVPNQAAIDIGEAREWFVEGVPVLGLALKPFGFMFYAILEAWFSFVGGILPW